MGLGMPLEEQVKHYDAVRILLKGRLLRVQRELRIPGLQWTTKNKLLAGLNGLTKAVEVIEDILDELAPE